MTSPFSRWGNKDIERVRLFVPSHSVNKELERSLRGHEWESRCGIMMWLMGIFPLGNPRPCLFHSLHLPTLRAPTMGHRVSENWDSWAHTPPPLFGARWQGGPGWQRERGHRAGSGNVFVCAGTWGHVLESVWIVLARFPGAAWSFLVIFQDRKWEWAGIKPAIENIRRKTTLKCGGCWCMLCMEGCCIPWGEHSSQTGWSGNAVSTRIILRQG